MALREVPGIRRGATLFTRDDGYYYRYTQVTSFKTTYTCYLKTCFAKIAVIRGSKEVSELEKYPAHNHGPDFLLEAKHVLRDKIFERVEKEALPIKRIYEEECNKVSPEVAEALIPLSSMESSLQKCRTKKSLSTSLPNSAIEFDSMIKSEQWSAKFSKTLDDKTFYRGNGMEDEKSNLVFISENAIEILKSTEELHVNVMPKTVSAVPQIKHLMVIHASNFGQVFPVAYVLMEQKSYASFKKIFEMIEEMVPDIKPNTILSDFETELMKALMDSFPNAEISGCLWHYCDCILMMMRKMELVKVARNDTNVWRVIQMCMCLPLLPAPDIEAALLEIRNHTNRTHVADQEKLGTIFNYINDHWIGKIGVENLSVYEEPKRTSNVFDLFTDKLERIMGCEPNPWSLIRYLQKIDKQSLDDYNKCKMQTPTRERRWTVISHDRVIKKLMQQYEAGSLAVIEMLMGAAEALDRIVGMPDDLGSKPNLSQQENDLNGGAGTCKKRMALKTKSGQAAKKKKKYIIEDCLEIFLPNNTDGESFSYDPLVEDTMDDSGMEFEPCINELEKDTLLKSNVKRKTSSPSPAKLPQVNAGTSKHSLMPLKRERKGCKLEKSVEDSPSRDLMAMASLLAEQLTKKNSKFSQSSTSNPHHAIDTFLAGVANTLKSLDPVLLNQAKSAIFTIVQDFELKQLNKNEENQQMIAVNTDHETFSEYITGSNESSHSFSTNESAEQPHSPNESHQEIKIKNSNEGTFLNFNVNE